MRELPTWTIERVRLKFRRRFVTYDWEDIRARRRISSSSGFIRPVQPGGLPGCFVFCECSSRDGPGLQGSYQPSVRTGWKAIRCASGWTDSDLYRPTNIGEQLSSHVAGD